MPAPSNSLSKAAPLTASVLDSGRSSLEPPSASKPATSLFGHLNTTPIQQNPSSSQPQQTNSLFGNTGSQSQQTGGLFGSSAQGGNNQQQGKGTNMFGATQGTGGGLFGSQQNPQQAGGLFASLGQNQNATQQQQQSKVFNGFDGQNKTSSLFSGNTPASNQNQQSTMQPPPSMFSSQIGQQQRQQIVPGVKVTIDELRPTTRFNDLHEELQKRIEFADNLILTQIRKYEDCFAANEKLDDMSSQMPPDIDYCAKTLDTMQQALENDAESIAFAKNLVKTDFDDAKLSFQIIQNLSLPQQFHHSALRISGAAPRPRGLLFSEEPGGEVGPMNVVDYFSKQAEEMSKSLDTFNRNIGEVERYLKGVESNTMQQMQQMMFTRTRDGGQKSAEDQVRELAVVLREFGNGIMGVATKVGDTREKIQDHMLRS